MDIVEIQNTIQELEQGQATYDSCIKLSALYNVLEHLSTDVVIDEYNDVLPSYTKYTDIKRKYQMHDATKELVIYSLQSVCTEITEFLHILYTHTDMPEERELIRNMLNEVASL